LDWEGGRLGVRLRYEPKDLALLYKEYMGAVSDAEAMRADVAPKFYPVLSSFPAVALPCWAGEAAGACAEPLA